ncbi:MAG: sugar phosphate isomerase/epimerase family protein [Caldilinea sp.]
MNASPVSVSTVAYDGHLLPVALDSLCGLNVQVVELAFIRGYSEGFDESIFDQDNAVTVRALLDARGLQCRTLSAHMDTSTPESLEPLRRRVEFAAALGASFVATNTGPAHNRAHFFANLAAIAPEAADRGITICIENPGDGIDAIVNDGSSGHKIVHAIDHPSIRMNYDFGNLMSHHRGHLNPAVDYRRALPVTVHFHVKDVIFDGAQWNHVAIGAGAIDYDTIFRQIREESIGAVLSIEAPTRLHRDPTGRPFISPAPLSIVEIEDVLRRSLAYIARHMTVQGNAHLARSSE